MRITKTAKCPACGSREVRDTRYTHADERTLECEECGQCFEESDA